MISWEYRLRISGTVPAAAFVVTDPPLESSKALRPVAAITSRSVSDTCKLDGTGRTLNIVEKFVLAVETRCWGEDFDASIELVQCFWFGPNMRHYFYWFTKKINKRYEPRKMKGILIPPRHTEDFPRVESRSCVEHYSTQSQNFVYLHSWSEVNVQQKTAIAAKRLKILL